MSKLSYPMVRRRACRRARRGRMAGCGLGVLLAVGLAAPALADSIFPDTHVQTRTEQAGPPAPDAAMPPRPHRSREEIDADIQSLEAERADLLSKYAPAHPDVRAVDRRLRILREQREMLDQAHPADR